MPSWYTLNDSVLCDCIPVAPLIPPLHRRFSSACRLVEVTPANPQVYFNIAPSIPLSGHQVTFNYQRTYMSVFRKGREDLLLVTYNVWRRDQNGALGFYFDQTFFDQPPGFYVGDVYIDCEYCFSVQMRLPRCSAVVTSCYSVPALETCGADICSIIQVTGEGMIGGGECAQAPETTECGTIAPFFPLDNPLAPIPVCEESSACCLVPDPAGFNPAGSP